MYETGAAETYVGALCREITEWREIEQPLSVDTIYFGGGTPSLLAPAQIEAILETVRNRFDWSASVPACIAPEGASPQATGTVALQSTCLNPEITIEINPASIAGPKPQGTYELSREKLQAFRLLGINRASFGAQTFDDRELKQLGRTHTATDIPATFHELRRAGFENINFDLIAGLPGQTLAGWRRNVDEALKLRPEHLSLYLLDVHEGTPLADQIQSGMRPKPDEDLAAEMYATMIETVCTAGYEHYEISNFCLSGRESRHNTKYWTGAPYYGFGNSAHSYDGAHRRWANERDAAKYVAMIGHASAAVVERTSLHREDLRSESIFLGLRLMSGIDLEHYRAQFGRDLRAEYNGELDRLRAAGLIEIDDERLRLTSRGALLSNEVFAALA
jgi:coproporphyrinogen III oxidase-like Fe-S oxidoreductase